MEVDIQGILHPAKTEQTKESRQELGDDGGNGYTGHTPSKAHHKQKVQNDIGQTGRHQEKQRHHRVAHAPQHTGDDIVIGHAGNAQEIDDQVRRCHIKDLCRRIHHTQKRRHQQRADDHNKKGSQQSQCDNRSHRVRQLGTAFGAKILSYYHIGSGGNTHKQHQKQIDHGTAGAHGGQGIVPHIAAHHNGVHRVVKLLSQISNQQRDGKLDEFFHWATHRHILGAHKAGKAFGHVITSFHDFHRQTV